MTFEGRYDRRGLILHNGRMFEHDDDVRGSATTPHTRYRVRGRESEGGGRELRGAAERPLSERRVASATPVTRLRHDALRGAT